MLNPNKDQYRRVLNYLTWNFENHQLATQLTNVF